MEHPAQPSRWLAACAPPIVLACALALASNGVYHDDDLTHYLMARWAWTDPVYLLHDWGRPGFTVPYASLAWVGSFAGGFLTCRFLTIAIAAVSAMLACMTAHALGVRRAWIAGLCLLAMPLYFRLSYTTLTETVCGLYLIGGSWLLATGRPRWAACVLALAPLARHEAVVFLALAAVPLALGREWRALLLLGWAEAAWNLAGARWYWMLPIQRYFEAKPIEGYGQGGTLHYALMWAVVATPVLAALSFAGAALALVRLGESRGPGSRLHALSAELARPRAAGALLVAAGTLAMIAVQTALYARNTFASGGYPRFLVPAAPWMAVLAASALEVLLDARRASPGPTGRRAARGVALLAALAVALLPVARAHTLDANGMIRGLYSGVGGEALACLWLPFAALGLAAAVRPGRRTLGAFLAVSVGWVAIEWGGQLEPLALNERQHLLASAVAAARRDAIRHGGGFEVLGSSPWVPYFARHESRASGATMREQWQRSNPAEPVYLVLDSGYCPTRDRAEILAASHRVVYAGRLTGTDPYAVDVYVRR